MIANRLAMKCVVLGLLLWILVPVSVGATNMINATYQDSYDLAMQLDDEEMPEDATDSEEENEKAFQ